MSLTARQAHAIAARTYGKHARTWTRSETGLVYVGHKANSRRVQLGYGETWEHALAMGGLIHRTHPPAHISTIDPVAALTTHHRETAA